jgi:hypothetical protein
MKTLNFKNTTMRKFLLLGLLTSLASCSEEDKPKQTYNSFQNYTSSIQVYNGTNALVDTENVTVQARKLSQIKNGTNIADLTYDSANKIASISVKKVSDNTLVQSKVLNRNAEGKIAKITTTYYGEDFERIEEVYDYTYLPNIGIKTTKFYSNGTSTVMPNKTVGFPTNNSSDVNNYSKANPYVSYNYYYGTFKTPYSNLVGLNELFLIFKDDFHSLQSMVYNKIVTTNGSTQTNTFVESTSNTNNYCLSQDFKTNSVTDKKLIYTYVFSN